MVTAWILLLSLWLAQAPEKTTLQGATNVTRLDASVMCAGATGTEAFPEIKKAGFAAILNLRRDSEPGVDIPAARAAAEANGLRYLHLPVDAAQITEDTVKQFLDIVTDPVNHPIYIHCGTANRVGALWAIKRVVVDRWDQERALTEAAAIGLTNPQLTSFVKQYLGDRGR